MDKRMNLEDWLLETDKGVIELLPDDFKDDLQAFIISMMRKSPIPHWRISRIVIEREIELQLRHIKDSVMLEVIKDYVKREKEYEESKGDKSGKGEKKLE